MSSRASPSAAFDRLLQDRLDDEELRRYQEREDTSELLSLRRKGRAASRDRAATFASAAAQVQMPEAKLL
jgi:hypothetical protein